MYFGFILKYIQSSIADMAYVEGIQESVFINQSTSRSVYDAGPCGHGGQLSGTDQCLIQAWDMKAEVVASREQVFQRADFYAVFGLYLLAQGGFFLEKDIVNQNFHSKTMGNAGYLLANATKTNQPQGFAKEFGTSCVRRFELVEFLCPPSWHFAVRMMQESA